MTPETVDLKTCILEIGKSDPFELYLRKGKRTVLRIPVSRINDLCCLLHKWRIALTHPSALQEQPHIHSVHLPRT